MILPHPKSFSKGEGLLMKRVKIYYCLYNHLLCDLFLRCKDNKLITIFVMLMRNEAR